MLLLLAQTLVPIVAAAETDPGTYRCCCWNRPWHLPLLLLLQQALVPTVAAAATSPGTYHGSVGGMGGWDRLGYWAGGDGGMLGVVGGTGWLGEWDGEGPRRGG